MNYPDVAAGPAVFHPAEEDLLTDDPFTAVSYHFGMLLGVDDFETELAYHRGRECLHQAWLHGPGVVWGLGVGLDFERSEIRIERGLAIDGAGRNLHLDVAACLNPGAWYEAHHDEVKATKAEDAEAVFDAHVTASFATCLTRPVPALAEPCAGADVETAYSRVWETVDLRLVPGLAPEPVDRYRRVRILLGLIPPDGSDADVQAADARKAVLGADETHRAAAAVAAFQAMANADAAQLSPPDTGDGPRLLTPADLALPVVLANIHLALVREGDALKLGGGRVDLLPRRSHVATATIQELTAANLLAVPDPSATAPPVAPAAVTVMNATLAGAGVGTEVDIVLALSAPLDARSVQPDAFAVASLGDNGWADLTFETPAYDAGTPAITLTLGAPPAVPWLVIARGSGAHPLVDAQARALGDGKDFVHIQGS